VPAGYQTAAPGDPRYPAGTTSRLSPVPAGTTAYSGTCYPQQYSCQPCPDVLVRQGYLRLAGVMVDYKRTYVLENSQNYPLAYVTAQPGVNLEDYKGKYVELAGTMYWRGDVRANYMNVSRVTPLK
jgi:hypothetical protein